MYMIACLTILGECKKKSQTSMIVYLVGMTEYKVFDIIQSGKSHFNQSNTIS